MTGRSPAANGVPKRCSATRLSLFLATCGALLLALAGDDLAQHRHTIAVHESDAGQALAILEGVANQRLLRLEAALRHLIGLQRVRLFHFLAARFLPHFPLELRDPARGAATADETNRRIPDLDLVRD